MSWHGYLLVLLILWYHSLMRIVWRWFMGWFPVNGNGYLWVWSSSFERLTSMLTLLHRFICCTWSMRLGVMDVVEAFQLGRSYFTQRYTFWGVGRRTLWFTGFSSSWFLPRCSCFGRMVRTCCERLCSSWVVCVDHWNCSWYFIDLSHLDV